MTFALRLALAAALLLPVAACGGDDDHGHGAARPTCDEIGEACHAFDTGSGAAHECHENAHDVFTEAQCVEARTACLAACSAVTVDGGAAGDGGVTVPDAGASLDAQ